MPHNILQENESDDDGEVLEEHVLQLVLWPFFEVLVEDCSLPRAAFCRGLCDGSRSLSPKQLKSPEAEGPHQPPFMLSVLAKKKTWAQLGRC